MLKSSSMSTGAMREMSDNSFLPFRSRKIHNSELILTWLIAALTICCESLPGTIIHRLASTAAGQNLNQ